MNPKGLGREGGKGPPSHALVPTAQPALAPNSRELWVPKRADWRGWEPERLSPPDPRSPPPATGMGVSTVTAARILKGQLHHSPGEETRLEMDKFPYVALSKVSSSPKPPTSQEERAGEWHSLEPSNLLAMQSALPGALWPLCELRTVAAAS